MRAIVFFAVLCQPLICGAQDTTRSAERPGRWNVGFSGSIDHCDRYLRKAGEDTDTGMLGELVNEVEQPIIGWSAGLDAKRDFGQHWSVLSGVHYSLRGYGSEQTYEWIAVDPVGADPDVPVSARSTFKFSYLEVPLVAMYSVGNNRLQGLLAAGMRGGLLIGATGRMIVQFGAGQEEMSDGPVEGMRRQSLMAIACIGGSYRIGERSRLRILPEARFAMGSATDGPLRSSLWSVGLTFGAAYRL